MDCPSVSRIVYLGAQRSPNWFMDNVNKTPEAKDGEVLVKVRLATICPNDLEVLSGDKFTHLPLVLGHEAVCEVIEDKRNFIDQENNVENSTQIHYDREAVSLSKGTRIVFSSSIPCLSCSCCRLCLPHFCKGAFAYGDVSITEGNGFSGCYATHLILRKGTHIIPVPPCISDKTAAPANCALALVVNAVEAARTTSINEVAIVQGTSIHGLYACAFLKHKGYKKVICWDEDKNRLKSVEKFGGEPCFATILEMSSDFADCCINVSGDSSVVPEGISAVRCGGSYVLARTTSSDAAVILPGELIKKCITIRGVHGYLPRHLHEAIQFLSDSNGSFPYDELISSRTYKLDEFEEAVHMANSNTFHRVAIHPQ